MRFLNDFHSGFSSGQGFEMNGHFMECLLHSRALEKKNKSDEG